MEPLIQKIRALLRLGEDGSGATEAEARLAMSKAHELAERHGIAMADLSCGNVRGDIVEASIEEDARLSSGAKWLANIVQKHMHVHIIAGECRLIFIGAAEHVEYATWVFRYLKDAMARGWKEHRRGARDAHLRSYQFGFVLGIDGVLKNSAQRAEGDAGEETRCSYALAIARNQEAIVAHVAARYRTRKTRASHINLRKHSFLHGRADGRTTQLAQPLAAGV